jgi:cytoskeletal protein CcmA (bactofilin family)
VENAPSSGNTNAAPQPEELKPRSEASANTPPTSTAPAPIKLKKRSYRPSHKATFVGLAAVILILAINAAIITFLLKKQAKTDGVGSKGQVTLSNADLSKLGINRNTIGDTGSELVVAPNAQFKGKLNVAGDTALAGQLLLSNKVSGTDATFTQLQSGKTSVSQLDINGDTTGSNLNLRKDLVVAGNAQFQGTVNMKQLLTVSNSANITGNLSIGGVLTVSTFSARSLGATAGTLASVAFHNQYGGLPRVVITPVGVGANFFIFNLTTSGFSVGVTSGLPAGGYLINFIAMQ